MVPLCTLWVNYIAEKYVCQWILGHNQAVEFGKFIASSGIKIDEILYSPLIRAAETARHISEEAKIPCKMEMRLKEQNFGKYESTPRVK